MRGHRWIVAVVLGVAAATALTGCGASSWCTPLQPAPSVTSEYAPTASRLEALPGVTGVTARYWQPDDSHCVSRESLETAAWSAAFTVDVRSGFTLEQISAVRTALGPSTATVRAAAGGNLSAWELELANPSGATPSPSAVPLLVDEQGWSLVTAAAALPDVTFVRHSSITDVRVRAPGAIVATAEWLQGRVGSAGSAWVSLGTATDPTADIAVVGISDATIATAASVAAAHPDLSSLSVSASGVSAVVPTEPQARQVVAAFEQTSRDQDGQRVTVWWPDGNGTEIAGEVGADAR